MASTTFTVYGFLGYERVLDGSVETNVLFAVADAKKSLLAWYGFRSKWAPWHFNQFADLYQGVVKPTLDSNFGSLFTLGNENFYPGPFGIHTVAPTSGTGTDARLTMSDDEKFPITRCALTFPAMKPLGLMLFFNLRCERKRRTLDLEKDGVVFLLVIQKFDPNGLINGPHPTDLRAKGFRK
jgi:hypothetical protein